MNICTKKGGDPLRKYQTVAGDVWDLIAFKTLGASRHVETLINVNREHINTFIFKAGIELNIPDVTSETSAKVNAPPWWSS